MYGIISSTLYARGLSRSFSSFDKNAALDSFVCSGHSAPSSIKLRRFASSSKAPRDKNLKSAGVHISIPPAVSFACMADCSKSCPVNRSIDAFGALQMYFAYFVIYSFAAASCFCTSPQFPA